MNLLGLHEHNETILKACFATPSKQQREMTYKGFTENRRPNVHPGLCIPPNLVPCGLIDLYAQTEWIRVIENLCEFMFLNHLFIGTDFLHTRKIID